MIARVSKLKFQLNFPDFLPNHGPGHLPLDSGREDDERATVCASVASLAVSFVPEFIFWNLVGAKEKELQARPGSLMKFWDLPIL